MIQTNSDDPGSTASSKDRNNQHEQCMEPVPGTNLSGRIVDSQPVTGDGRAELPLSDDEFRSLKSSLSRLTLKQARKIVGSNTPIKQVYAICLGVVGVVVTSFSLGYGFNGYLIKNTMELAELKNQLKEAETRNVIDKAGRENERLRTELAEAQKRGSEKTAIEGQYKNNTDRLLYFFWLCQLEDTRTHDGLYSPKCVNQFQDYIKRMVREGSASVEKGKASTRIGQNQEYESFYDTQELYFKHSLDASQMGLYHNDVSEFFSKYGPYRLPVRVELP